MPVVTVLIPTYDHSSTLRYSVRSIQEQTFEDIEIFVVGDGAPPQTASVMAELCQQDPRIRYFPNPKGAGHGELHRAQALNHAQGKFIFYCGDDDLWLSHHVATLLPFLESADFVNTHQVEICPKGTITVLDGSFSSEFCQLRMQQKRWNICGPTSVAHSLQAYRKLPHGWQPRPEGALSDLHMWRQWLSQKWCKFHTHSAVTTLHFPSPLRKGWSVEERVAELEEWWTRTTQPGFQQWLEDKWHSDWRKRCVSVNFFIEMGHALLKHKEYSLAEEAFRKAYEAENQQHLFSTTAQIAAMISQTLLAQNKLQEALHFARQACALDDNNAFYYKLLGKVFFKLQKYEQALENFTHSLQLQENAKLYRNISKCYTQLNNRKKAKEFYKKFRVAKKQR